MTDPHPPSPSHPHGAPDRRDDGPGTAGHTLAPLPGEPGIPNVAERVRTPMSRKGLLAVGLLIASLVAVSAFSIQRFAASGRKSGDDASRRVSDQPTAATAEPRRLEMPVAAAASADPTRPPRIPALVPTAREMAEPIGVHRTGQGAGGRTAAPEDAPVMLVATRPGTGGPAGTRAGIGAAAADDGAPAPDAASTATNRDLQAYRHQLQGLLDTLTHTVDAAAGQGPGGSALGGTGAGGALRGGSAGGGATTPMGNARGGPQAVAATPRVTATMLGNRSLTLPKGTAFTCALKTRVISAASGLVGCQVQRNVYGDDGRVLLIERGSHMDGEYRIASVRPGTVRIPVVWTRIRTPNGVTIDIDSPGTGALGEAGIDGYVDNRWVERIGAAMLLSLIDDTVKLAIQDQANRNSGATQGTTVVLPSTMANTGKLAGTVLDSTINIPPLIYQNQGGIVGIYVARDVDFSSVYELKPTSRDLPR